MKFKYKLIYVVIILIILFSIFFIWQYSAYKVDVNPDHPNCSFGSVFRWYTPKCPGYGVSCIQVARPICMPFLFDIMNWY